MINPEEIVPLNYKFACYALSGFTSCVEQVTKLDSNFWVLNSNPFPLEDYWKEWLGKIKVDHLASCNFLIIAAKESKKPEILDNEHSDLSKQVNQFFNMLFLEGAPIYQRATVISGSHVSQGIEVRGTSEMRRPYKNYYAKPFKIFQT